MNKNIVVPLWFDEWYKSFGGNEHYLNARLFSYLELVLVMDWKGLEKQKINSLMPHK